jgi:PPOX class probable F420-dependent enzyme
MSPARFDELPAWALELVEAAPVARLGLLDDRDRPRVLPVTFARAGDDLWSAVDHKAKRVAGAELARIRWLRRRPEAALTLDRYDADWSRLAWVQALGRVEVLDDAAPGALDALRAKYPQYADQPPAGPFLRLRVDRFVHWRATAP